MKKEPSAGKSPKPKSRQAKRSRPETPVPERAKPESRKTKNPPQEAPVPKKVKPGSRQVESPGPETRVPKKMKQESPSPGEEIGELRERVRELEETLDAIRSGEVDAIVVAKGDDHQVYTLEGADQPYRILVENIREGVLTLAEDGSILYGNTQFGAMLHTPCRKIFGSSFADHVCEEDRPVVAGLLRNARAGPVTCRLSLCHKDGFLPVQVTLNSLVAGGRTRISAIITDRKEDEDRIRMQARMLDATGDAVIASDTEGRIIYWNDAATKTYGWKRKEAMGRNLTSLLVPEPSQPEVRKIAARLLKGEKWTGRYVVRHRDGHPFSIHATDAPLFDENGDLTAIISASHDITAQVMAEEQLQYHAMLAETVTDAIISTDEQLRIRSWNKAAERMYGWHAEEVLGKIGSEILRTEFPEPAGRETLTGALFETGSWMGELVQHTKDGRKIVVEATSISIRDRAGNVTGDVSVVRDITERKRSEQALRESEERFRTVAEFTYDWEFWIGPEGNILYNSPSAEKILGRNVSGIRSFEEILRMVTHPDDLDMRLAHLTEEKAGKGPFELEYRIVKPGGEVRWIHHVCQPVFNADGHFLGIRGSNRDITERKQAEEALRKSGEEFRHVVENAPASIYEISADGLRFNRVNDVMCRTLGYTREELMAMNPFSILDDESRKRFRERVEKRSAGEEIDESVAYRVLAKDGRELWVTLNIKLNPDRGESTLVVAHDVTERKQAEEALQRAHERTIMVLESISDSFLAVDRDWRFTYVNRRATLPANLIPADVIGKTIWEVFPEITGTPLETFYRGAMERKEPVVYENRSTVVHGRTFELHAYPTSDDGLAIFGQDITPRKEAEEALREAHQRTATILEGIADTFYSLDNEWRFTTVNPAAEKAPFGKPAAELLGRVIWDLYPNLVGSRIHRRYLDAAERFSLEHYEAKSPLNGRWYEVFMQGRKGGVDVYMRDITGRKHAEEALLKARNDLELRVEERTAELKAAMESVSTERHRLYDVLEALPVYVCLLDQDYRMPFANRYFREAFASPEGRRCHDFLFSRNEPCENCESYKVMKTRAPHHWFWTGPNGRDYDIYDFPFHDSDGSFMILEMGIDITEQKKAEAGLQKAYAYNRSLIEASLDPLVTIDTDGKISDVNEATIRVTGCSRDDLIGTDFSGYFTDPARAEAGYEKVFRDGSVTDYGLEIRHRDGQIIPVLYNATVYRDTTGKVIGVFAAARDITERKKAEDALLKAHDLLEKRVKERTSELVRSNAQLKEEIFQRRNAESLVKKTVSELHAAIESTADGIYVVDRAGRIIRYNQNFASMWNVPADLLQSGDDRAVSEYLRTQVKNPGLFRESIEHREPPRDRETYEMLELSDGRIFERYSKPQKMDAAVIGRVMSYRDVTDRRHAEEKLLASLQEKETLIREIHHRVKNNLQIISGLLDMTRMRTPDSTTTGILTDMMMKIKTMAQIHTRLYESKQFDKINMGSQIRDQVTDMTSIYGRSGTEVQSEITTEDVYLPVDQAIPCALVVNEILSNAFKHAFRGRKHGNLRVSVTREADAVRIIVKDDGIGIPGDVDVYKTTSLGFKLIRSLVLQLNGSVNISSNQGTEVTVECPFRPGGK